MQPWFHHQVQGGGGAGAIPTLLTVPAFCDKQMTGEWENAGQVGKRLQQDR